MNKIIKILEENARYTNKEISVMLGISEGEVAQSIAEMEKNGVIRGYKVIVNHDLIAEEFVEAVIELKVTPKRDFGFDEVAERVAQFDEVEDVNLMSGSYDLSLVVKGKTFKDIALFVSQRLATLDSVLSTATHFVLSRYKEKGIVNKDASADERGNASV